MVGSGLAGRYAAIGAVLAAGDADVACFQEVITWWHLGLLWSRMRSFPHVSYRSSRAGPAGGVVTFSRLPVAHSAYHGFGLPPEAPGISRGVRLRAGLKGVLATTLGTSGLSVVNTHPVANWDGDWTQGNRFYPLHQAQLAVLARVMRKVPGPAVLCGDFNLARGSSLFDDFMSETGLSDAFEGSCPPTFRAEYLPEGKVPHCIDFILTAGGVKAEDATLAFTAQEPLPGGPGYVSDHIGLRATLVFNPGRGVRLNVAGHDAVAFQAAQRHGEHPPGGAVNVALQFAKPERPLGQPADDGDRLFSQSALGGGRSVVTGRRW